MRTQDIVVGEYYRHVSSPTYGYARAIEILRPKPAYKCKTEFERAIKTTVVRCAWSVDKDNLYGRIRYFKPAFLQKDQP